MSEPLVSVIMPYFNEDRYIAAAIQSVLAQTYQNIELLLIDDNSTDKSWDICLGFRDPRIRMYRKSTEPRGLAASRNIGVAMARGQYVAMQDADDLSAPTRLEKQLARAMEDPARTVAGTAAIQVQDGKQKLLAVPEKHEDIVKGFSRIYNRTTIICGTMLAPRTVFMQIPYRVQFKFMQDWDHVLRLHESNMVRFSNCTEPLYTYFIRSKCSLYRPNWLDYNILIRNCQQRRKAGLREFNDPGDFNDYLRTHPIERVKWLGLKHIIGLRNKALRTIRTICSS